MLLPVWVGLFVLVFASTFGAVHVFLRARSLWRTFKAVGFAVERALGQLTDAAERLTTSLESAGSSTPRLEASVARLRRSLARVAVLRGAVQDAQDSVERLAAVYPRK